jgi:hypothetical protein
MANEMVYGEEWAAHSVEEEAGEVVLSPAPHNFHLDLKILCLRGTGISPRFSLLV